MAPLLTLRGITWNHTRGYLPLVAASQRFSEMYPDIAIEWSKRSLQEFAQMSVEQLATHFDLLIIDHPSLGQAHQALLPLDQHLPAIFLAQLNRHTVGQSHKSYQFADHQWALAIDAAAPVSSYRADLLAKEQLALPQHWEDILALARAGKIVLPAIPIDSLMHFYMLCCGLGEEPFGQPDYVVSSEVGITALHSLYELLHLCDPACLQRNPIATYEYMNASEHFLYCPFAYGYSNYARQEYSARPLTFGNLVSFQGQPLRSTLGGAGLALSRQCNHLQAALDFIQFVADEPCQRGLYAVNGGQPGHRLAWLDTAVNQRCNTFFLDTLATLDEAYLRPRASWSLHFQEQAGLIVHEYLVQGGSPETVLHLLNKLYLDVRA